MRILIVAVISLVFLNQFSIGQDSVGEKKGSRHVISFAISNFDQINLESTPNRATNIIIDKIKAKNNLTSFANAIQYGDNEESKSKALFDNIMKLEEAIKDEDEVVLYISSHGVEVVGSEIRQSRSNIRDKGELLYIVTNESKENWIPMVEIVKLFSKPKFKKAKKLIIVDTCRAYDSKESDDQIIGSKWKNYAEKTEGFDKPDQELKKFFDGDLTADLNLAIMYACGSGMKSYFLEEEKYGFFSESLKKALSFDKKGVYSLRQVFEVTKSLTIWENKIKRNQRQEPVLLVYSKKSNDNSTPFYKSKSFENEWYFGVPIVPSEKEELEKIMSGSDVKDLGVDNGNKIRKLKLVNLEKIEQFQKDIIKIQNKFHIILGYTRSPSAYRSNEGLIKSIKHILKYNDDNLNRNFAYYEIVYFLLEKIEADQKKINQANIEKSRPLIEKINEAFTEVAQNINAKIEVIQDINQDVKEFFESYQKDEIIEFLKETQKLRDLLSN